MLATAAFLLASVQKTEPPCATECQHKSCLDFGIHYGTYCGVGHTGCPGVKPCDGYDACCEAHDNCVGEHSVASQPCHAALSHCLKEALDNGTKTWIDERVNSGGAPPEGEAAKCTADNIVKTMSGGMQLASLFSMFAGGMGKKSGGNEHALAAPASGTSHPSSLDRQRSIASSSLDHHQIRSDHQHLVEEHQKFAERHAAHEKLFKEMKERREASEKRREESEKRRLNRGGWRKQSRELEEDRGTKEGEEAVVTGEATKSTHSSGEQYISPDQARELSD